MKASIITTIIAAALFGLASAASGFLGSCSEFAITNLNGDSGRSMMLQASCKVDDKHKSWSQLDLNRCFGWSKDSCGFTYPPSADFTSTVSKCSNNFSGGDEHFGANFGCYGPCSGGGNAYNVFALSKFGCLSCFASPHACFQSLIQFTQTSTSATTTVGLSAKLGIANFDSRSPLRWRLIT